MTLEQQLAFGLVLGMVALFVWGRPRYDLVALLGLGAALAIGIVPPKDAFSGFSDDVVVIVASALVLSAAVSRSGVLGLLLRRLEPWTRSSGQQVAVLVPAVTALSSFLKNIGALAIFVPFALQTSRRSGTPPSLVLMPMAFGSLMGGVVTLVGTSPNLLVSRVREQVLGEPFRMFDFAPVGLAIVAAGLAFLMVGWRLLPGDRRPRAQAEDAFRLEPYLSEVRVESDSQLVGRTVQDLEKRGEGELAVTTILREGRSPLVPHQDRTLRAGDVLLLRCDPHALQSLVAGSGLSLVGAKDSVTRTLSREEIGVVEAIVMPGSQLVGRTATELDLRDRHGVNLIAVSRRDRPLTSRLRHLQLQAGDVIVLQGAAEAMPAILAELDCLPLVDRALVLGRRRNIWLPLIVLAAVIGLVAFEVLPVASGFFMAAVVVVLLGSLTLREAYDAIDVPILVLLACMIPIGAAIETTGGAALIAAWLLDVAVGLPPSGALAIVIVAAMAVTPFLNNAATVLIMAPIGANLAQRLGLNPDPFLMAVAIGAACDFLTPIGHQCNTLVLGVGGYRFADYPRLGLPLSIIVAVVATLVIPWVWPFR